MTRLPILYDEECRFCRVCVAVVLSWDRTGRLRPVPLGSDEANDLLRGIPEDERMASWHLVEPEVRSAGAAFSPLFRLLPGGRPLARLTDTFPRAAERGYRWVADRRSAFGRPLPQAATRWADRVISGSRSESR